MIRDFFINGTIIIAAISLGGQFYRNREIGPKSKFLEKAILGVFLGLLGVLLMLFSVGVTKTLMMDFRNIAIALSAIMGGMTSALITGIVIVSFRTLYWGLDIYSLYAIFTGLLMALMCGIISRANISDIKKWMYMYIFNLMTSSITLGILMGFNQSFMKNIIYFIIGNTITAAFVYYYYQYVSQSNNMYRQLKDESSKDFLTCLNNVRSFDKIFNYAQKTTMERDEKLSLLMIDIDFFKKVNDTYGHHEGDIVLKELGRILVESVRIYDVVSRNGGEEFSVILLDCDHKQSLNIAEKVRKAVEEHHFILNSGKAIRVTVSIGSATYPETTSDMDKLTEQADMALYMAKRTGRNKVCSGYDV